MTNPFLNHRLLLLALPLTGLLAGPVRAQVAASFAPPVTYSAPGFSGITVADINGDGQPDVFTTNFNNNTVGVFLGISPANGGGFQPLQVYSTGAGSQPRDVAVADVNLDGLLDLVTANNGTSSAGVLLGKSGGGFQPVQQYMTEPQTLYRTGPYDVKVADVNSDGQPDLVVANFTTNSVGVLLGKSVANGGGFQAAQVYSVGSASLPSDVEVADFNKDGVLDLVTANSNGNGVGVLLGKSAANGGGFQPVQFYSTTRTSTFTYPFKVAVADVNLDGVLDIVSANSNTYSVGVLLGKSPANGGGFEPVQEYITVNRKPYDIAVADVNGDNLPDLLVTQSNTIVVLRGKSAASGGGFEPVQEVPGSGGEIKVADINADGRPDLLTDGLIVLLNTVGSPTLTTAPATNLTATSATLGGTLTGISTGALTEYGVVYVQGVGTPTISDTKVVVSTSAPATLPSTFSASVTGLTDSRTYTVRAYATSSLGTGYGNPVTFSTPRPTTAAPVFTTPANGATTNALPTFAGTASAGSTITVYLVAGSSAAQAIGTTSAVGGSFSFTPTSFLADGSYSVYATAQLSGQLVSANSSTNTFTVDATPPTVVSFTRQNPAAALTNATAVTYRLTFSEPVTGVSGNSVSVIIFGALTGNTTSPVATQLSTSVYDFTLNNLLGNGIVSLSFSNSGVNRTVVDLVGNRLPILYVASPAYTIDQTAPTATLTSTAGSTTSTSPIPFTVTFSEAVTGFSASGISVTNGTIATAITSAGNTYSFGVTPTASGAVTVSVLAGAAQDAAGNGSGAAVPYSITYSQPVRVAPTTVADAYTTPLDVLLTGNVLTNDIGANLRAILIIRPTHGALSLNPDGSFTYQPTAGYTGSDSFLYYACDTDTPLLCGNPVTVSITVQRVGPITVADAYTTLQGVPLTSNVLSNDLGANLRAILIIRPTHGTLALNPDGSFTYQPAAGYTGPDSFLYYACNMGTPLVCGDPATVAITVTPSTNTRVATSPTAVPTSASSSSPAATAAKPVAATGAIVRLELALTAHPNPFCDEFQLHFTLPTSQAYTLAVYDAQGRLVRQLASGQAEASQAQELTVPTHTYATGLYLVRLTTATGTQQLKLIKQ